MPRGNGAVSSSPASRVELGPGHKTVRTSERLASAGALGIRQSSTGSFPTATVQDRELHACEWDPELDPERTCGCGDATGGAPPSSAANRWHFFWGGQLHGGPCPSWPVSFLARVFSLVCVANVLPSACYNGLAKNRQSGRQPRLPAAVRNACGCGRRTQTGVTKENPIEGHGWTRSLGFAPVLVPPVLVPQCFRTAGASGQRSITRQRESRQHVRTT